MKKEKLLSVVVFLVFLICFTYRMVDGELYQIYSQYGMSYDCVKSANHIETSNELVPMVKSALENGEDVYVVARGVSFDEFKSTVKDVSEEYGYSGYLDLYSFAKKGNVFYAKPMYIDGKDEYLRKMVAVRTRVDNIVKVIIKPEWSDFEKELAIHDYIVENTQYDSKNYTDSEIPEDDNTAYGVLINGVGMCAGYSELMHRMLEATNIESKIVYGYSEKKGHAWNIVKIEGEYYHVDATFDDPVLTDGAQVVSHQYFNLDDTEILKNHSFAKEKFPTCYSKEFNYYEYKHLIVRSRVELGNIIKGGIIEKEKNITVKTADYDIRTYNTDVVYDILAKDTKINYVDVSHGFNYSYDKDSYIMSIYLKYNQTKQID